MFRKAVVAVAIAGLGGCYTYEPVPYRADSTLVTKPDAAADVLIKCSSLGFYRGSDGDRLCILRGIDRLGTETRYSQLPKAAPIEILPPGYTYPPMAPQYVVPGAACATCTFPGQFGGHPPY